MDLVLEAYEGNCSYSSSELSPSTRDLLRKRDGESLEAYHERVATRIPFGDFFKMLSDNSSNQCALYHTMASLHCLRIAADEFKKQEEKQEEEQEEEQDDDEADDEAGDEAGDEADDEGDDEGDAKGAASSKRKRTD